MGELLLIDEEFVNSPPQSVFGLIERSASTGWWFDASGAGLTPGRVARFSFTLPAHMGGRTVEATGRVVQVVPGRLIVIAHETPWRGQISFRLTPSGGGGTRVRLVANLPEGSLEWLRRQTGVEALGPDDGSHKLGLLVSQSGSASVFAAASENLARLAVEEINADGGIRGRALSLVVGDDATDPSTGVSELLRLVRRGCRAVLTNVTSATFDAIEPVATRAGILLIYTPVNEGGNTSTRLFRLGERPAGQLKASVPTLMKVSGSRHWYLAGNDYVWPRATNRVAERVISRHGGIVVGERYERLGSRDFSPLLEDIARSGAELVVSTFVGADEACFERQFFDAGLRDRTRTLALALDESTREHIGDAAANGLWTAFGYFEQLPIQSNRALIKRYRDHYGSISPPVSSISESVYEAAHFYAAAASDAGGDDLAETGRRLCGRCLDGPRGRVRIARPGLLEQSMYIAEAVPGGFSILAEAFG